MGFKAPASAQGAWEPCPVGPPGPSRPEPAGPGCWSRKPPSRSSGVSRTRSTLCPPRSPGGLRVGELSGGPGADPGPPLQGWGHTGIHVDAPLEGGKESLPLKHLHCVRGLGAAVPLQQAPQGCIHLGAPAASEPDTGHPGPPPLTWPGPTLLRGRHCSRTCSGSRRLCSAMRLTRWSRSRCQALLARCSTQALVVYHSQYLGAGGEVGLNTWGWEGGTGRLEGTLTRRSA